MLACLTSQLDGGTYLIDVKQIEGQIGYFIKFEDQVDRWVQIQRPNKPIHSSWFVNVSMWDFFFLKGFLCGT
jgi:hypothetical protein